MPSLRQENSMNIGPGVWVLDIVSQRWELSDMWKSYLLYRQMYCTEKCSLDTKLNLRVDVIFWSDEAKSGRGLNLLWWVFPPMNNKCLWVFLLPQEYHQGLQGDTHCPELLPYNFMASQSSLLDGLFLCAQNMHRNGTDELVELLPAPGVRKATYSPQLLSFSLNTSPPGTYQMWDKFNGFSILLK